MREPEIPRIVSKKRLKPSLPHAAEKRGRAGRRLCLLLTSIMTVFLMSGCGHLDESRSTFEEANNLFSQGNYMASLSKYDQIVRKYPATADRVLFEMGVIYAYPKNDRKDYQKSLECFQRLLKDYPASEYRQNSEMMIFNINNASVKDKTIGAQQKQIETLQLVAKSRDSEIVALRKLIKTQEQRFFDYAVRNGSIDRIVIEKKARRLMLISKGEVIKTYRIALGGNPIGPKEREGDNKTPEGTYIIDSRNKNSLYHRALHISYPNEADKRRAKQLGVSPGGNIMIHGIKNGLSWVGDAQSEVDWTKGCIALTDREIEELDKLAPNGTVVEIRP